MNFYDDQKITTRELFEKFFPGREDVVRLLMEPITYANGSTLEDPAITYGIVFSNFMAKGVFIYEGGTDDLVTKMAKELKKNGVDAGSIVKYQDRHGRHGVEGVIVNDRLINAELSSATRIFAIRSLTWWDKKTLTHSSLQMRKRFD